MKSCSLFLSTLFVWHASTGIASDLAGPKHKVHLSEEFVEFYCADEWARFSGREPEFWTNVEPLQIDPETDIESHNALGRWRVAILTLDDFLGAFVGFANPTNQNAAYAELAKMKYDLAMCLVPTAKERDLLIKLNQKISDAPVDELRTLLFGSFDHFDCMQFASASEAIFALYADDPNASFDFAALTEKHMKSCD